MVFQPGLAAVLLILGFVPAGAAAEYERRPVFAALHGGGSEFDADFQFAGDLGFDPEDSGDTFGIGLAYEVTSHWFFQLDWTRTDADELEIDQVFLSVNYQRPLFIPRMKGMIGLVVGEGRLEWNSQPAFADAVIDDLEDDEGLYGIQLGLSYDLGRHWSTSLTYQYFEQEFDTSVETSADGILEFEHSNHHYLLFGIRFHL